MTGGSRRFVAALPADAAMMLKIAAHWIQLKRSPRKTRPDRAPNAGSKLISTPTVRVGKRGIANISREYGSALDSSATPSAAGSIAGEKSCAPA